MLYDKWSNYFYRNIQNQYESPFFWLTKKKEFGHFEYQTFDKRKYQSYGQFKSYNKWSNYFCRNIQNQHESLDISSIKHSTSASINHMTGCKCQSYGQFKSYNKRSNYFCRNIQNQCESTFFWLTKKKEFGHFEYQSYDKCKYQSYGQFKSYSKWSNYFCRNIQNQYELFGHFEYQSFNKRKYQSYDKMQISIIWPMVVPFLLRTFFADSLKKIKIYL